MEACAMKVRHPGASTFPSEKVDSSPVLVAPTASKAEQATLRTFAASSSSKTPAFNSSNSWPRRKRRTPRVESSSPRILIQPPFTSTMAHPDTTSIIFTPYPFISRIIFLCSRLPTVDKCIFPPISACKWLRISVRTRATNPVTSVLRGLLGAVVSSSDPVSRCFPHHMAASRSRIKRVYCNTLSSSSSPGGPQEQSCAGSM
mmetsp:Transcript_58137/g.127441  ORF Transcript_58137/g.127441 Transcript_58137/m.127441 type:complete len:202 (-) Transcript_58137:98-703(-)